MAYVLIGNSAAAIGAIEGVRSVDLDGEIILFSDEPYHTYSRPLISYYLDGKVQEEKMYYRPADFYKRNRVEAHLGSRVAALAPEKKTITLADGQTVPYDKLLLATGGKPIVPPLPGRELDGVFTFLKWDDVKALEQTLAPGMRTVVIGAGLIGLKATEALVKRGVAVTVVELANRVLSAILDEAAARLVQESMLEHGVKFYLENTVAEVLGRDGKVAGVRLRDGAEIPCERLVIAIGVFPNTDLAQGTAIKVNRGIVVDERMATTVPDIFAAGDVTEGFDTIYQQQRVLPILPNAYKQGFTAGINMAGEVRAYKGGFAMNSIGFFDLPLITAGIVRPEGEGYLSLTQADPGARKYKKVVLKDNKVVGFIALNQIDRAGILTGLMEQEVDASPFLEHLLREDFGYAYLPAAYRQEQMLKGVSGGVRA